MTQFTPELASLPKFSTIYALYDELSVCRYVGVTVGTIRARLLRHLRDAKKGSKTHCANWIRAMAVAPTIVALEVTQDRIEREIYWIAHFREMGNSLTNLTSGGEGFLGYAPWLGKRFSEEHRAKISAGLQGKKHKPISEQSRINISEGQKARYSVPGVRGTMFGRHQSDEAKAKLSIACKGRKLTVEHRAKISAAGQKRIYAKLSEIARKNIRDARLRVVATGVVGGMQGKHHSEETRSRLREAAMLQWARKRELATMGEKEE